MNFLDDRLPAHLWDALSPCPMSGCWIWTRPNIKGTKRIKVNGKDEAVHYLLFELAGNERPDIGHRLLPKCENDLCVNPHHLEKRIRGRNLERDLTGKVFSYLTVIEQAASIVLKTGERCRRWVCRCVCGATHTVREWAVVHGSIKSCGCRVPATRRTRGYRKHGQTKNYAFTVWQGLNARCYRPGASGYANYGARGIRVCDRWRGEDGFFNFISDMGARPHGASIDRIDPNGNYEPLNCRWATAKEQANNTRTARKRVARVLDAMRKRDPKLIADLEKMLLGKAA